MSNYGKNSVNFMLRIQVNESEIQKYLSRAKFIFMKTRNILKESRIKRC